MEVKAREFVTLKECEAYINSFLKENDAIEIRIEPVIRGKAKTFMVLVIY